MTNTNSQLSLDEMIQLAEKIKDWKFSKDSKDECYKGTLNNMEVIIGKVEDSVGPLNPFPPSFESYIKVVFDGNEVGNYRERLRDLFSNKNRESLHNLEEFYSSLESKRMKNLRELAKTG